MTRKLLGCLLLGLGLSSILLPILQALVFFTLGVFILRTKFDWARAAVERASRRFPATLRTAESAEARLLAWSQRQVAWLRGRVP
jgi:hypothetical protein